MFLQLLKGFLATGPGFLRNWPEKHLVASLALVPTCLVSVWKWEHSGVVDGAGGSMEVLDTLPGRALPAGGGTGNVNICTFPILLHRTRLCLTSVNTQTSAQDPAKIPNV